MISIQNHRYSQGSGDANRRAFPDSYSTDRSADGQTDSSTDRRKRAVYTSNNASHPIRTNQHTAKIIQLESKRTPQLYTSKPAGHY